MFISRLFDPARLLVRDFEQTSIDTVEDARNRDRPIG